ncbi:MAG: methyltransferase [bacterium]|nr:MAG: methyltransferase [bacterium]
MRIIAGKYKSRKITPPKNLPVRPTTDRARESLFNVLNNLVDFREITALDLFSGTGAISFELVSRGCNEVTAVDQNRQCVEWIRNATKNFQIENLQIRQADSFRFMTQSPQKYHLIFADPPYNMNRIEDISRQVFKNDLLKEDGWLVIEHPKEIDFSEQQYFSGHRKYGKVNFSFFHFVNNG